MEAKTISLRISGREAALIERLARQLQLTQSESWLVDSGPLIALFDCDDAHHQRIKAFLRADAHVLKP